MDEQTKQEKQRFDNLRRYLELDPDNKGLALDFARTALSVGESDAASEGTFNALSRHPGDHELMFMLGTCMLSGNRFDEAASQYQALIDAAVDHPAIRFNLAYAHYQSGNPQGAFEALAELKDEQWADVPDADLLFARCCHHLERYADGVRHYRRHLAAHPEDSLVWGELSLLLFDDDQTTASIEAAEHALRLEADTVPAMIAIGSVALEKQETSEALSQFGRAVELQPQNGRAWSGLGFSRLLALDIDASKQAFQSAVRFMPNHIGTWHGLAWTQILQNDLAEAEKSFEHAMGIDRNFGETHGGLAVISALRGDQSAAEKMIRRGSGLNPQSFSARYARSLLLAKSGHQNEAKSLIKSTLAIGQADGLDGFQKMASQVVAQAMGIRREAAKPKSNKTTPQ